MALRVLLADESPTIKKVFLISLQDFGVEVKSVPVGLDVIEVTKQFQPDIIFADILLQKKNGYEVSRDLKADPNLAQIPVILMWSGFMELDQAKLAEAKSDGQIEKPFDVDTLRSIIHKLVPKTANQTLGQHLVFPTLPKLEVTQPGPQQTTPQVMAPPPQAPVVAPPPPAPVVAPPPPQAIVAPPPPTPVVAPPPPAPVVVPPTPSIEKTMTRSWTMESFEPPPDGDTVVEEAEQFAQVPLKKIHEYRVEVPPAGQDEVDIAAATGAPKASPPPPAVHSVGSTNSNPAPIADLKGLTEGQIEEIIRAQTREVIERLVWKLVPDIATNLIKEEIRRLTEEPKL